MPDILSSADGDIPAIKLGRDSGRATAIAPR